MAKKKDKLAAVEKWYKKVGSHKQIRKLDDTTIEKEHSRIKEGIIQFAFSGRRRKIGKHRANQKNQKRDRQNENRSDRTQAGRTRRML